jgi:hypothetical protein
MEMSYVTCSTFLIHWQPNPEPQNGGPTQPTILNGLHFQLELKIIEIPLIKYSKNHYFLKAGWD